MQVYRNESGFSVIEILVVTIIGSLIFVAILQSFEITEQVWKRNSIQADFNYQVSRCFDYIGNDLATVFSGNEDYPMIGSDGQSETGDDADELQCVTTDGRLPAPNRYDLIRVKYRLGQAEGETPTLVRILDPLPFILDDAEGVESDEEVDPDTPFDGSLVRTVNLRYYNGSEWLDSWDSRTGHSLPLLIEVSLGFVDPRKPDKIQIYTRNIRLLNGGPISGIGAN